MVAEHEQARLALYPWQEGPWTEFVAPALGRGELHHGLLIVGADGLGKRRFAEVLAAALLCQDPAEAGRPCGQCRGCHLYATGAHPDAIRLDDNGGERSSIGVDQVRELANGLGLSSQYGGARVGLIAPADRLTVNAANSLLKTLEEPPQRAYLILVASRPSRLPATIRSRCQLLRLPLPPRTEARQWLARQAGGASGAALLELAGGAPLAALSLAEGGAAERLEQLVESLEAVARGRASPVTAASAWKDKGQARQLVAWVEPLASDLARARVAGSEWLRIWDPVRIQGWYEALSSERLQGFLTWLAETRRDLDQPLNDQLVAESLFIRWRQAADFGK